MSKTEQKMPIRAVVIFAYDGAQLIAGPTQPLTTANEEGASPPYAVRLAAVSSGPIRTASGVKLIAEPLPRAVTIDTLLVPGGPGVHMFRKDRGALAALRRLCMRSRRICAVCTGAFALAEIGLLNKCRVVTHWRSCAQLAEEFPEVCVDPEPLFIQVRKDMDDRRCHCRYRFESRADRAGSQCGPCDKCRSATRRLHEAARWPTTVQ